MRGGGPRLAEQGPARALLCPAVAFGLFSASGCLWLLCRGWEGPLLEIADGAVSLGRVNPSCSVREPAPPPWEKAEL